MIWNHSINGKNAKIVCTKTKFKANYLIKIYNNESSGFLFQIIYFEDE